MSESVTIGNEKFHWVDGQWVEGDALRIAEQVSEYDPNLRVQYLEYAASIGDPPFRIVERGRDGVDYTVFYAWKLNGAVLERIRQADNVRRNVQAEVEKKNAAVRLNLKRRYEERAENAREVAKFIGGSSKDTLIVNDEFTGKKLKISTTKPVEELN